MTQATLVQEPQDLTIGSTNTVRLLEWEDTDDGSSTADWTVLLTAVLDASGAPIAGTTNIAMPFVDATTAHPRCYKGVIPSSVVLVAGACTSRITATIGSKVRRFDIPGSIVANPDVA
jgi:hypothetical protein